jgi:hypothetical protein
MMKRVLLVTNSVLTGELLVEQFAQGEGRPWQARGSFTESWAGSRPRALSLSRSDSPEAKAQMRALNVKQGVL